MQYRLLSLPLFFILLSALLSGCGVPSLSGGNQSSSSSDATTGFQSTIGINIEATSGMLDDLVAGSDIKLEDMIFDALTPAKAFAFRGLSSITSLSKNAISVVALGPNLSGSLDSSTATAEPLYEVEELENGNYVIKFRDKLEPQINLVIKVDLPNGAAFYGPLYETGDTESNILNPIDINIGTTYVINTLFNAINNNATLEQLLPCSNPNIDCNTQHKAKVQLLKNASTNAAFFEIEFEKTTGFNQSLALLENNTGFSNAVDIAVQEILRTESPIAKGTPRTEIPLDATPWTREYNSSYFNIAMNDYRPSDGSNEVILSAASSSIIDAGELKNIDGDSINTQPIYPKLITNTDLREIRRDAAVPLLPFARTSVLINANNNYFEIDEDSFQFYSSSIQNGDLSNQSEQAASVFSRFLSTEGQLLLDRDIPQQILGRESNSQIIGWNYDPIYSRLYQSNYVEPSFTSTQNNITLDYLSSPTWLTSAYYGGGKAFNLSTLTAGATFSIDEEREQANIYSWEIHGQETNSDFSAADLRGKEYGVLSYGLKLEISDPTIKVSADTFKWIADSNFSVTQTQPDTHYQSLTLERLVDSFVEASSSDPLANIVRSIYTIDTEEVTQQNPLGSSSVQGLLGLDGGSRAPLGHSTQNGKHLAFSLDTRDEGRGLIVAAELRNSTPVFRSDESPYRFKIQGNTVEMGAGENAATTFRNLTDSELLISASSIADCSATISLRYIKTEHDNEENTISTIKDSEEQLAANLIQDTSTDCRFSGGEVEITFPELLEAGNPLTLKGFMSHASDEGSTPGNLMSLLWIQPGSLGLVFAQRDVELDSSF